MDTVTHALAGALAGRAGGRDTPAAGLDRRRAAFATLAACIFPDIDFVIALVDPYAYLVWHRLLTHSFVMLPVWAAALAALAGLVDRHNSWRDYLPFMVVGMSLHIVMDLFNIWPLIPFWPLSDWTVALPVLFVIDPVYTLIAVTGLLASLLWRPRAGAVLGLAGLALYTAIQFPLNALAERQASASGGMAEPGQAQVFAQPLSPLHRRVVVTNPDGLSWAYLRTHGGSSPPGSAAGFWRGLWRGYRPASELEWQEALHPLAAGSLVAEAWLHPELERYRSFATMPYLYGIDQASGRLCVWFADARFTLPTMEPPFRYGMCRGTEGDWARYRRGRW
jgi:inner membrane protein